MSSEKIEDRIKQLENDASIIKTILTFFITRINDKGKITDFSSHDGQRLLELLNLLP